MTTTNIIVQKFGGSSVSEPDKIKAVAHYIKKSLSCDQRICVVVSAMGNTTNELLQLAYQVSKNPVKRELDMLVSCGERSSMALLAMALQEIGVQAISLTGSQSGIITNNDHLGAQILEVKPHRVLEAFKSHQVVIVAGFQGVSLNKEITTLRRGGSDTTAVAMAAALNASMCEIYTDVPGVMDADPKIVAHAQVLPVINFATMESMALYGARVLAHDAIMLAQAQGVQLRVLQTDKPNLGTIINEEKNKLDLEKSVISITHLRGVIELRSERNLLHQIENEQGYFLCGGMDGQDFVLYVSNDLSQELVSQDVVRNKGLALMTLHLTKNRYALKILGIIHSLQNNHNWQIRNLFVGKNEIFIVVQDADLAKIIADIYSAVRSQEAEYE